MYPLWRPVGSYKRYKKTCEKCQNNCETDTFPVTMIGETFKINLDFNNDQASKKSAMLYRTIYTKLKKLKGTPMQIWKSANIFVFTWKWYVEDFTLKHLLISEVCARKICEKFVYKYSEPTF